MGHLNSSGKKRQQLSPGGTSHRGSRLDGIDVVLKVCGRLPGSVHSSVAALGGLAAIEDFLAQFAASSRGIKRIR